MEGFERYDRKGGGGGGISGNLTNYLQSLPPLFYSDKRQNEGSGGKPG